MRHNYATPSDPETTLDRQARRRASAKLGWYTHAAVYIVVNIFLAILSSRSGHNWAVFPALGWGLGLALHGVVVWIRVSHTGFYTRMVARERASLQRNTPSAAAAPADPW